jgi:RNA-binding protein YlmH
MGVYVLSNNEKEELLKYAKTDEDRLFLARLLDKANQADRGYLVNSRFMDPHQKSIARRMLHEIGSKFIFEGGYPEAERALSFFVPDYMILASEEETLASLRNNPSYPVTLVQVDLKKGPYTKEMTHRDYLGALMNLGITRETLGDILVHKEFAQIITLSEIAPFIENNLTQVGRASVSAGTIRLDELVPPILKFEMKTATVASLRLDAIVAEGFNLSRSEASEYIGTGKVYLQFEECCNVSKLVEEGDTVSLRGAGRIVLDRVGGISKKSRVFITILKYV